MGMNRRPSPSDVTDDAWAFVAPSLRLTSQPAAQRQYGLREVFNREVFDAVRSMVRIGAPWRWLSTNGLPREAVYQQTRRWTAAGSFPGIVYDPRVLACVTAARRPQPSVSLVDRRTLRSPVESGCFSERRKRGLGADAPPRRGPAPTLPAGQPAQRR
jgi:transposase